MQAQSLQIYKVVRSWNEKRGRRNRHHIQL